MIFPFTEEKKVAQEGAKNEEATIPLRVGPPTKRKDISELSEKLKRLSEKNLQRSEDGTVSQFELTTDILHDGVPRVVMWYARLTRGELEELMKEYKNKRVSTSAVETPP